MLLQVIGDLIVFLFGTLAKFLTWPYRKCCKKRVVIPAAQANNQGPERPATASTEATPRPQEATPGPQQEKESPKGDEKEDNRNYFPEIKKYQKGLI